MSAPLSGGVRYTSEKKGHVESYFFKANDREGARAVWLKTTIFSPKDHATGTIAETWAIAFDREHGHVAAKQSVPFSSARFAADELRSHVADLEFSSDRIAGRVTTGAHVIKCDLRVQARGTGMAPLPYDWMYTAPFPSSKFASPIWDADITGTLVVDGTPWDLSGWRGMLGHNWGKRHSPEYAWAHANVWTDMDGRPMDLVFEGVSARVAVGPLRTPRLSLMAVRFSGVDYLFHSPEALLLSPSDVSTRRWSFRASSPFATVFGEFRAETRDMVGLHYENPAAPVTYCLNSKLATGELTLTRRGRASVMFRTNAAALEIGTHESDHGVEMVL